MNSAAKRVLNIGVLISGGGRTLKNFIELVEAGDLPVQIRLVVASTPHAGGLQHAQTASIPCLVVERETFPAGTAGDQAFSGQIFTALRAAEVDYVVMAGFLKFLPIPADFHERAINIHPALIPSFCGSGMYGDRVHAAVLERGAKVTGCTVHFVDNEYDHGPIIWQEAVAVENDDTPASLASRVFECEKKVYPFVLRKLAEGKIRVDGQRVRVEE